MIDSLDTKIRRLRAGTALAPWARRARSVVVHHPNDEAEQRRHHHYVHELRAVLASESTVPREVMYFDRVALFLNVATGTHIDASNHP
jgi:hypothetical protein